MFLTLEIINDKSYTSQVLRYTLLNRDFINIFGRVQCVEYIET